MIPRGTVRRNRGIRVAPLLDLVPIYQQIQHVFEAEGGGYAVDGHHGAGGERSSNCQRRGESKQPPERVALPNISGHTRSSIQVWLRASTMLTEEFRWRCRASVRRSRVDMRDTRWTHARPQPVDTPPCASNADRTTSAFPRFGSLAAHAALRKCSTPARRPAEKAGPWRLRGRARTACEAGSNRKG